jgi:hypothetical protein
MKAAAASTSKNERVSFIVFSSGLGDSGARYIVDATPGDEVTRVGLMDSCEPMSPVLLLV